jgi:hypothetical protein
VARLPEQYGEQESGDNMSTLSASSRLSVLAGLTVVPIGVMLALGVLAAVYLPPNLWSPPAALAIRSATTAVQAAAETATAISDRLAAYAVPSTIRFANDQTKDALLITLEVRNQAQIDHLRVIITETGTNQVRAVLEPIPVAPEIKIPFKDLSGAFIINVSTIAANGQILREAGIYFVCYPRTATPNGTSMVLRTSTPAPVVVGAIPVTVRYADNQTQDALLIRLRLFGVEQIDHLRVTITDAETGKVRLSFERIPLALEIRIPYENSWSSKSLITIFAIAADGRVLSTAPIAFVHTIHYTPTATGMLNVTLLAGVSLREVNLDRVQQALIIRVETANRLLIKHYQVELINFNTQETIQSFAADTPPYDTLTIPAGALPLSRYVLRLRGLNADGEPVTDLAQVEFIFFLPSPTPTITPVPTATPSGGVITW